MTPLTHGFPGQVALRQAFPMANPQKLTGALQALPSGRKQFLRIGASASVLFEHGYKGPPNLEAFRAYMLEHKNEPMPLKPGAEIITSLLDLNYLTEETLPLVTLEIHTRMGDACTERLIHSLKACGFEAHINNDFIPVTQYAPRDPNDSSALVQNVLNAGLDFFFASSEDVAVQLNLAGMGAGIFYPNPDITPFEPLKQRVYLTDGDGAFWSDHFEREFQRIYQGESGPGKDPAAVLLAAKNKWYDYVSHEGRHKMNPGPIMALFQGLSRLAGIFDAEHDKPNPLALGLVTTRDHRGGIAVADFLAACGVHLDIRNYMSGNPKNPRLIGSTAFFEDDPKHLERALVLPGSQRPKGMIVVPHGIKHEMMSAGQPPVSDGKGTKEGGAGRNIVDVGSRGDLSK